MIEKLTNIAFHSSLDDLMVHGYGFKKIKEENDGLKRVYARYYNNDWENTIVISILKSPNPIEKEKNGLKHFEKKPNILDVSVAKNYNITSIKDNILSRGFEYMGIDEDLGLIVYTKGKYSYLVAKKPNKNGWTQIMYTAD